MTLSGFCDADLVTTEMAHKVQSSWYRCPTCHELTFRTRFEHLSCVCPGCGHHSRLNAGERLAQILDPGSAIPLENVVVTEDPLGFVDTQSYVTRLDTARATTGAAEAITCVAGTVQGYPVVAAVMDFRFMGGSLGIGVGERLARAASTACSTRTPLLLVTASGGARMQEGGLALMQMAVASQALAALDESGVLTISLITDPTYGGVAASYATLADVIIAEPGARIGFAGPRVIRETIGQELPERFQTAEFMLERGFIDAVVPRTALRTVLASLLSVQSGSRRQNPRDRDVPLVRDAAQLPESDAWQAVQLARHLDRPTTLDYVAHLLDDFLELHGDRVSGDCLAIVGGIGRFDGRAIVVVGHQKGRDTAERVARSFGMASPAGYRKAGRLMRLAAKLGLPIVTLVDTPGAHPGIESEQGGQAWAIADNIRLMSRLPVPIVSVIIGEGGSGGALALAVADRVLALSGSIYSVISPEGCGAILWGDRVAAPKAAAALRLTARDLLGQGIADAVVPEPPPGAHRDPVSTAELLGGALIATLDELLEIGRSDLVERRRARFRAFATKGAG